jgi:hypothetical protein
MYSLLLLLIMFRISLKIIDCSVHSVMMRLVGKKYYYYEKAINKFKKMLKVIARTTGRELESFHVEKIFSSYEATHSCVLKVLKEL